jgi:pimeloyl-ACP methyl ester carboxylesterase
VSEVRASDGLRLYAEAHGEGTPVVFSCGYATTHENFRPQVEPLVAAGARVVLWDYRGHGRSDVPDDPASYSIEQVVDDLARVLDWAAPGRPVVVGGLSLGGLVSLHFALAHPERVRGLLLLDSGPGFKNPEAAARWRTEVERAAGILEERGMQALLRGNAAATAVGRRPELPAAQAAAEAIAAQDPRAVAAFGRRVAGPAPPVIDELARIGVPALVLVGEKDAAYLRAAEVMAARLPKATKVVVPGAGHIGNIEEAEAFNAAVARFLAELAEPG